MKSNDSDRTGNDTSRVAGGAVSHADLGWDEVEAEGTHGCQSKVARAPACAVNRREADGGLFSCAVIWFGLNCLIAVNSSNRSVDPRAPQTWPSGPRQGRAFGREESQSVNLFTFRLRKDSTAPAQGFDYDRLRPSKGERLRRSRIQLLQPAGESGLVTP